MLKSVQGLTQSLTVHFVDSEAQVPAKLWDTCFPPPLEGRWWYRVLEASNLRTSHALCRDLGRSGCCRAGSGI